MNEEEKQFKERIKEIARLELKNSFTDNLMETLNSAFIFKYVQTLEEQYADSKNRINKAIEYIENNSCGNIKITYGKELLKILKGDKEW